MTDRSSTSWFRRFCAAILACLSIRSPLHRRWATVWLAGLIALGLSTAAAAQSDGQETRSFFLSTATTGGAFHQGGVSLSALVKLKLLPDARIDLTTSNSTGSLENIARLRDGRSDFAIVQALLGSFAWNGTGIAESLGEQREMRAVTMLWPNVEHFILRRDLAKTGTITDFLALKGQSVSLGGERSAVESNRLLLGNLGLNIEEDLDPAFLSFRPSVSAFRDGTIDGLSLPASTPVPSLVDLMGQLGPEATILSWSEEQMREADGGLGLWSPLTIPAGTYPGQTAPIETIAQPNFLAVRADVDEEVVYALTKTMFENLPFLRRLHKPFTFLNRETATAGLPVPLHPGARRYYEEIGLDLERAFVAQSDYRLFGDDLDTPAAIRQRVDQGVVELMTAEDGTSDRMVNDLLDVMSTSDKVRVLPIKGRGTAHNLADLLYLRGIDIGILQADAMDRERQRGVYPDLVSNIRYITKWADTEVHLLVRDDILNLKDLRDQAVNFGPSGSGSEVTAALMFNTLRLPVQQTSFGHAVALDKLKAGEIAGMVHVAPKPVPLFEDVEVRDGLRFLPLPEDLSPKDVNGSKLYRPADLTVEDYPTLIFGRQTIKTLAVPSVLATYNWPTDSDRFQPIADFIESFLQSLNELQSQPHHTKWGDIDPTFVLDGWRRHPVVDAYLQQLRTAEEITGRGGPLTVPNTRYQASDGDGVRKTPSVEAGDGVGDQAVPSTRPVRSLPLKPVF